MSFTYSIEIKSQYAVVAFHGSLLSAFEAKPFMEELHEVRKNISKFVIDLQGLNHLSSEGLGILLQILTKARNAGGDAVIINISEDIQKLFIVTKLNSIFTIKNNLTEASQFYAGK